MTTIYCLLLNNTPFYIGKTLRPNSRFNSHKRTYKCDILILDEVNDNEWKFWEKYYISLYKSWGYELLNKNNGGGGPTTITFSKERNIKISEKLKGISRPYNLKIPKVFILNHKINQGKKHSEEVKLKMSKSHLGKKCSDETKLKMSKVRLGKKRSDETKLKMSISAKNKPKSEQHIKNMMSNRMNVINGVKIANSKPVIQYTLKNEFIKEWRSVIDAKNEIGGDIYSCCNNKQKTAGGYIWKFKN
jgi:hypothetical protein